MGKSPKHSVSATVSETIDYAAAGVKTVERELQATVRPLRRSVLERFPILFTLLTTFGVAAVFFGFERILSEVTYLYERPWLILLLGIGILVSTGSLYKVLGRSRR